VGEGGHRRGVPLLIDGVGQVGAPVSALSVTPVGQAAGVATTDHVHVDEKLISGSWTQLPDPVNATVVWYRDGIVREWMAPDRRY
jgi:hypothetical protein